MKGEKKTKERKASGRTVSVSGKEKHKENSIKQGRG